MADGIGDGGGAVLGGDDGVDAGGIGGTEAGAEVMGVGDAVEDEDEGVGLVLDDFVEVLFGADFGGQGVVGVLVRAERLRRRLGFLQREERERER